MGSNIINCTKEFMFFPSLGVFECVFLSPTQIPLNFGGNPDQDLALAIFKGFLNIGR